MIIVSHDRRALPGKGCGRSTNQNISTIVYCLEAMETTLSLFLLLFSRNPSNLAVGANQRSEDNDGSQRGRFWTDMAGPRTKNPEKGSWKIIYIRFV